MAHLEDCAYQKTRFPESAHEVFIEWHYKNQPRNNPLWPIKIINYLIRYQK
jgi:hypothetical protein